MHENRGFLNFFDLMSEPQHLHLLPSQLSEALVELDLDVLERLPLSTASRNLLLGVGREFNRFMKELGTPLDWTLIERYFQTLVDHDPPPSPATLNSKKYALKKLLLAQRNFQNSPMARVALDQHFATLRPYRLDTRVHEGQYLCERDISNLVRVCYEGKDRQIRLGIIIQALFETGCRVSELLGIRLQDCEPRDHHIVIRIVGKGNKERQVYMKTKTQSMARTFFQGNTWLFESERGTQVFRNNIFRSIQRITQQMGIEGAIHPHTFRHSCAMHLLKVRKLNPKAVSEYLGHSDVSITLKAYIHDMPRASEVLDIEEPPSVDHLDQDPV